MKKYRNPNIPKTTPGDSKSEATRYKTQPVKPEPTPKPKPDKKKKRGADKVGNVFIPDFSKPKGNRLKFLNQLSEINMKKR